MSDLPVSPNNPQGKKELSMEVRLLIAFALMFLVLFVTPYIYKPTPAPKSIAAPTTPAQAAQVTKKTEAPPAPPPIQSVPGEIKAASEQTYFIDTDLYKIQFTNTGAVVKSWVLKKFVDSAGKPLELVNTASFQKVPPPFAISLKDDGVSKELNYAPFVAKPAPDNLGIDFEFSDGKNFCRKSFRFSKNSYMSQVTTEVTQDGRPVQHLIAWRGGFGDATVLNRAAQQHALLYDVGQNKLVTKTAKDAKDGTITATGNYSFAGQDDLFFAYVFLPKDNTTTVVETLKDDVPASQGAKDEPHVGTAVGGDSVNRFAMFVGPKDIDILRKVDPKLQQLINWGFFGVVAKPLFLALHWINDNVARNYGWAIVLLTIGINLALFPLRLSSLKSQKKMQALQPHIQAINAKYKGISLRDPKKAEQNQEVMELYKKHGVNPMGGCLPMLIQLPILYAFYTVLGVTIELRGAHWLWVSDLSRPESWPIHVLPVVMIVTQFVMQKMTPSPGMDPSQARMMQLMPLMFGFFFYNMSSGLVLYWLTGNLVGIVQQLLLNRLMPTPQIAPPPAPPQKKKR
jgi:YidC/Oxa1 family membrane protein insertase